jgi:pimeloyl-ACP methyl ester carboxylesterase
VLISHGDIIAFDLPGYGGTRRPDRNVTVEDHAALVAERLTAMGVGPVVVVGHSMGVQFAIELARQHPELVSHVVLSGPVVDPAHRTLRAQTLGLVRDSPLEPPRTQLSVTVDYLRCGIRWFLRQAEVMRNYPTLVAIDDVTRPVLVLRGANDPIAGRDWCARLAGLARAGRLVEIPANRHNVPHSAPAAMAAAILEFVGGEGLARRTRAPRHSATGPVTLSGS